jgi:Holliday junction resolvase RusA-like endonuclease
LLSLPHIPSDAIFIPGNTASSKNSKQWTGTRLIWSKLAREYRDNTAIFYSMYRLKFQASCKGKDKPLKVGFYFVRDSRRKFDFVNMVQTVQDIIVRAEWLPDDNMDEMVPVPVEVNGQVYHVDKENPGVYIMVL